MDPFRGLVGFRPRNGEMAEWRNGGMAEWRMEGQIAERPEWQNGGMVMEWRNGGMGCGMADRHGQWPEELFKSNRVRRVAKAVSCTFILCSFGYLLREP